MKILHISPTYFSPESVIGGGERYAYELARAMAAREDVVFLSFHPEPASYDAEKLKVKYIPTCFSWPFLQNILWADIIHCHQVRCLSVDMALVIGRILGKKVFVADLGGGGKFAFSYHLPLLRLADAFLHISDYSKSLWCKMPWKSRPKKNRVVYGGVDEKRFSPTHLKKRENVLYVGRLLSHKGIDYLLDAVDERTPVDIVGKAYDLKYLELLKAKSVGKNVTIHSDIDDEKLIQKYRESMVTVQASVYETCFGQKTQVPELLGLVALESMACGTPVIVTEVASLPEIVEDGITGFIVPPNNPAALSEKIDFLRNHPEVANEMGEKARQRVLNLFTWNIIVERCLEAYGQ